MTYEELPCFLLMVRKHPLNRTGLGSQIRRISALMQHLLRRGSDCSLLNGTEMHSAEHSLENHHLPELIWAKC